MTVDLSQLRAALALDRFGLGAERTHEHWLVVHSAARLFLAEREAGQKVWWCQEHGIGDAVRPTPEVCWWSLSTRGPRAPKPCRMVEAWLTIEAP